MHALIQVTFLEGIRSRILYGIFVFSVFVVFLSIIFSNFFMQDLGKVAVDFNLSAISFAGLLISASLSVNLISKDLDKRTIYFVLSRPISRVQYVWGKYLGLLSVFLFAYLLLLVVTSLALWFLQSIHAAYFESFSWIAYLQAVYFDFIKIMVFNAIIVLFGVITTSSFMNLLFSVSVYIIGHSISDVLNFMSLEQGSEVVTPAIEKVIFLVKYLVPNFESFDFKVISAHGMIIGSYEFMVFSLYGIIYSFIVIVFASLIFNKRELL